MLKIPKGSGVKTPKIKNQFMDSVYPFGIFKLFLSFENIPPGTMLTIVLLLI
jgi:hypothetical protein